MTKRDVGPAGPRGPPRAPAGPKYGRSSVRSWVARVPIFPVLHRILYGQEPGARHISGVRPADTCPVFLLLEEGSDVLPAVHVKCPAGSIDIIYPQEIHTTTLAQPSLLPASQPMCVAWRTSSALGGWMTCSSCGPWATRGPSATGATSPSASPRSTRAHWCIAPRYDPVELCPASAAHYPALSTPTPHSSPLTSIIFVSCRNSGACVMFPVSLLQGVRK